MTPSKRWVRLDVLRGIAILLVLGRHHPEGQFPLTGPVEELFFLWYRIGWAGVDLFFVLSGFLVSGLLFREYELHGSIGIKRFFIRRGFKIYPAFYLMIAVSILILGNRISTKNVLVETFFLQSYFSSDTVWDHTWTLAVEEHFYLVLGFLLVVLSKNRTRDPFRILFWIWVFFAVLCIYFRLDTPYNIPDVFIPTHKRLDGLFFGVFLSYLYHFHKPALMSYVRQHRFFLMVVSALLLSPVFFLLIGTEPFMTRFGLTLTYLGFGVILLLALETDPGNESRNWFEKILAGVGVRSYSIYLWHYPWMRLVAQPLVDTHGGPLGLWASVTIYLVGAIAMGYASYHWIEKPMLRFRDRRFPSKA